MAMGDMPDWASRLGTAVGAALSVGFAPDQKKPTTKDDLTQKKLPPSSGSSSSSWTQYLPYVAAGVGGLLLLKMAMGRRS